MAFQSSSSFFHRPSLVYGSAIILRAILLIYGAWQDAHSAVKYTDIDYMVFTDAARYVSRGESPYARDTYRYTPLLAWLLVPTSWAEANGAWFLFGKALFAMSDVLAGWLIVKSLTSASSYGMDAARARKYASVWLLNPMVANISTRGSSEGLLCVMVVALLWAVLRGRVTLAGVLLGLSVHFKIYPFVYGAAVVWWLDDEREESLSGVSELKSKSSSSTVSSSATKKEEEEQVDRDRGILSQISSFLTPSRLHLTLTALATFSALNLSMYILYGYPFLHHTYLHHVTRIDHRHNFSPYSTLLYLSAASTGTGTASGTGTGMEAEVGTVHGSFESLAFIPQLFLSVVAIPLVLGKKSLAGTMLAQTFAFVMFNKVCTSQYFLWYLIFLPFYLPSSSLLQRPKLGLLAAGLWVLAQALWLQQGYLLEFLGMSSFVPGLYLAGLGFFTVNVWLLGFIVGDVGSI